MPLSQCRNCVVKWTGMGTLHTWTTYKTYFVRGLGSQEVSCKSLQLLMGHVFKSSQAAPCHGLFEVDCRVTERVHCSRHCFIAGIQYLHCCDPHHAAIQGAWKTYAFLLGTRDTMTIPSHSFRKENADIFCVVFFSLPPRNIFWSFPPLMILYTALPLLFLLL